MEDLRAYLKSIEDYKLKDYVNDLFLGTHVPQELADFIPEHMWCQAIMVTNLLVMQEAAKRFVRG